MSIKYVGQVGDYSGYGEAARHDILALLSQGVDVTTQSLKYTLEIADFGSIWEKVYNTIDKEIAYDTIILHTTPDIYPRYFEDGKRHIARVFWETDCIPIPWVETINRCSEVWTGSRYNASAIEKAGVKIPIYVIPQACEEISSDNYLPYKTLADGTFRFYSLFEWTYRKNPAALLEAYWKEFEGQEDVSLTIKTYLDNHTREKRGEINSYIEAVKENLKLSHYAKLYLFRNLMDRSQIYRFHRSFDCFVSAHRGEGWGIPQMEAMLMQNAVISTKCGGIHEYYKDYPYFVDYTLVPLSGNNRNMLWYSGNQQWASVDIAKLRSAMRSCYVMGKDVHNLGKTLRQQTLAMFNPDIVGKQMIKRLYDQ